MKTLGRIHHQLLTSVLCAAGALTFAATAQAPNDMRIALIIGNSAYAGNMALANPSNDAKDMAATLRNMGFGVIEVLDGNRAQMMDAIERANKQLQGKQGVGMLFYAGHGLQLDWRNYMVPVDAKLNNSKDVPLQTVDIEVVMKSFQQAGNRMNIVVLDACRDDPFANGKTSTGKGLAPLDAPTGTFLAYATAPGNVAQDGTGKNGLYTGFLLQELQKPTARIEDVFKRVRFAVRKASNGAQIPWETTSLEDDFVFNSGVKKIVEQSKREIDNQFDIEKAEWDRIKENKSADPFYAFIQKYPNGLMAATASNMIERLSVAKTASFKDKLGQTVSASALLQYKLGDNVTYERTDGFTKNKELIRRTVEKINDGKAYFSDGSILTLSGETVVDSQFNHMFDPPLVNLPSENLKIGAKWQSRSKIKMGRGPVMGQTGSFDVEGRVTAFESITVRAGTFLTYKVEALGFIAPWGTRREAIYWITPDGFVLKQNFESRYRGGREFWSEEAVSITRGAS